MASALLTTGDTETEVTKPAPTQVRMASLCILEKRVTAVDQHIAFLQMRQ
jgi:hypothetical protein